MKRRNLSKRFFSLLLAILLVAACAPDAFAAEPGFSNFQNRVNQYADGVFHDVGDDWFRDYVAAVYELGLMQGDTEGMFLPDKGVTLAETCALAARIHQLYFTGSAEFSQGSPWYQVYVDYCHEKGILNGDYDDYDAPANRREFAVLLSCALPESALPVINDIEDGSIPDVVAGGAGVAAIYRLYRAGILTGNDVYGTFAPESDIKRSEVAAIVSRMAFRSLRRTVTLLPKPPYPDLQEGERQEDDFFKDAAMLGNSLVDGMMLCSGIPMAYYGKQSGTVRMNRVSELVLKQYGKVYIQLGINDLGSSLDSFIEGYRKIVDQIRAAMPEADIYLMAVTPVTQAVSARGLFTMQKIGDMNDAIRRLAEEEQCWYLDCCTPLCTEEGFLIQKYAGWDGSPHLDASGYVAWAEVIRTHYAPIVESDD